METTEHEFYGPVERTTLDNGLTVLLKPMDFSTAVSVQVWIEAGSLYENDENNGLSHFLEHMLFKGTRSFSGEEINQMAERFGGKQNAGTSKDYTTYYVNLPPDHWEIGLELLHEMAFHATLPEDEFHRERDVVLSELARYRDNPSKRLWQKFIPKLYGDHPYHRLTIGEKNVIEATTHDQLLDYYHQFYVPPRTSVVVAGDFPKDEVLATIQERYGEESDPGNPVESFPPATPPRDNPGPEIIPSDVQHVYGILGTTGFPVESKQSLALDLLMEVFGSSQTSRLYENLVLKQPLATSLSGHFWSQRETGPVMVQIQTEPDRLKALLEGIADEADKLLNEGIREGEYRRALTQIKTDFIYSAQSASGQANQLGYWESIHEIPYLETYVEQIEQIEPDLVMDVAQELFRKQNWTGVFLVPEAADKPSSLSHPLPLEANQ